VSDATNLASLWTGAQIPVVADGSHDLAVATALLAAKSTSTAPATLTLAVVVALELKDLA
jgi:hypothetical protein